MIIESIRTKEENISDNISYKEMIPLSIATSIDAFVAGITIISTNKNIVITVIIIGIITFILSFIGSIIGYTFGNKYRRISKVIGGAILIIIGLKKLIDL